jgi:hypothetical protein
MSAVFAQSGIFEGASVPPLPASPLIERVLLENPWPSAVVCVLVGVVVFMMLNSRRKARLGLAIGALVFGLGVVAVVLAGLIETDREAIKRSSRALVAAVASVDVAALERLLDEDMELRVTGVSRGAGKEQTIAAVQRYLGSMYSVREHRVLDLQSTLDGPRLGRTQVRVRVETDGGMLPSWWRLDWLRANDGSWTVRRIEAMWIPGVSSPGG